MYKYMGALVICLVFLLNFGLVKTLSADIGAPYFDDCADEYKSGYWSYPYGNYSVPGLNESVNGENDVYLTVRSSYYQCLCTTGDNSSIQANWWRVDDVDEDTIQNFVNQGWVRASGSDWNMPEGSYLVKNMTYSCSNSAVPTSSVTPIPSAVPTVVVDPTPTTQPVVSNPDDGREIGGPSGGGNVSAPVCNDAVLDAPTLVSVIKSGSDSVDLVWTSVNEATDYMISYGVESGNYIYGVPTTGKIMTFRIGSLDLSKQYYFQVRAIKGCMPGDPSNELAYPQSVAIGGQVLGLAATSGIGYGLYVMIVVSGLSIVTWLWRRYAKTN